MSDASKQPGPLELRRYGRSLNDRLRNEARARKIATDYVRKQYVFALFFNRLFAEEHSDWVLLGGNALLVRIGGGRFTRDIDLARDTPWTDAEAVLAELRSFVGGTSIDDPFRFDLQKITPHRQADAFGYGTSTATVSVSAYLGTQHFESFTIDLTSRRHVEGSVELIRPDPIIEHQSLANLREVPVVPVENHLADKLCALYEIHNNGPSNRYRDLADVVRIIQHLKFEAQRLATVLAHETQRRKMRTPSKIDAPSDLWVSQYPEAAADFAEFPRELWPLKSSLEVAAHCLDAVLSGEITSGQWDPKQQKWI
jgi:predicted nucleotidyltransferase component of viral defense system